MKFHKLAFLTALLGAVSFAWAQQYVISTYVGGTPPPTPVVGVNASVGYPAGVASDASGNVYFASLNCVFKLDRNGTLTLLAGNSRPGYSGDGGPATGAQLNLGGPNFFYVDSGTVGVAVDGAGNVYVADIGNSRVRKISVAGIITTVAGNGTAGYSGDGGAAVSAQLAIPLAVAVDTTGNVFIDDFGNGRIRKVSPAGIMTTVAGTGVSGYSGDGGPAASAEVNQPRGIATDGAGNLYIADTGNSRIRKVSTAGIITSITQASPSLSIAVDSSGNVFAADTGRVYRVSPGGALTTIAGGGTSGYPGDGGPATNAQLSALGITVDSSGNIFIADFGGNRIRKVSSSGVITTVAGNGLLSFSGDGGQVNSARIYGPGGTALDATGNLYFADSGNFRIRKVSTTGIITTIAGNGTQGFSGDGGPAISATFNGLGDIAIDGAGNLYIVDFIRVRKVTPQGIITTVAGTNTTGYSGDGGPAVNAVLNYPAGIAVDSTGNVGNVYIADQRNNRIRKVISSTGIITTVAGNGTAAYSGDGGTAINASLNSPAGIALDNSGNLYVADQGNNRIRMVSSAGTITTIAGNGTVGFSGNGGSALNASLRSPIAVTVDSKGSIYLLDSFAGSNGIRLSAISTAGVITTIAGIANSSLYTLTPDGAPATSVGISASAVTVDVSGNLYISEVYPNVIRVLRPVNQSVLISAVVDAASSMAGSISPGKIVVIYGGGLGPSTLAQFQVSNGLVGTQLAGTTVSFNGTAAPVIYSSATQVAAIVPYQIAGTTAQVTVSYQGQSSTAFTVPFAAAAPGLFSLNQTGAGQAAAINIADGTVNTAANPVKIGGYISLFATGEGQTTPAGVDGKVASGSVLPAPTLKVSVMVGGIPATVQYAGAAPGDVAGVMQVNVQIPAGVQPGGYVPVLLQVGSATTTTGAAWIAVAGN